MYRIGQDEKPGCGSCTQFSVVLQPIAACLLVSQVSSGLVNLVHKNSKRFLNYLTVYYIHAIRLDSINGVHNYV